jgi:hypothetical protein
MTRLLFVSVLALLLATGAVAQSIELDFSRVAEIESPSAGQSGEPNLFSAPRGEVLLSWIEESPSGHTLKFARRTSDGWSDDHTIAKGDTWFVNWADFPSLVMLPDGTMAAHWLQKSSKDTYSYDVRISWSSDGGAGWSSGIKPHQDGTETEHGFVSMLPWSDREVLVVWLDGRKFAPGKDGAEPAKEMTLRAAVMNDKGELSKEAELDGRVCECCQTTGTLTPAGALFAYRDRSADEIRDIGIVRYTKQGWTAPSTLHNDGWKIPGCPVNGPATDSLDDLATVAWFTVANDVGRVKLAFSTDAGATFGQPIRVDDGDPMGRVDVVVLDHTTTLVSWLEQVGTVAQIRLRAIHTDGTRGASHVLSAASPERASGFPIMAKGNGEIVFAWTEVGEPAVIRTAVLPIHQNK